jgi:hypothetical protein
MFYLKAMAKNSKAETSTTMMIVATSLESKFRK